MKTSGPRGLFSGWGATALRDAPSAGLYVLFYERFKSLLGKKDSQGGNEFSSLVNMGAGIFAGGASTILTQPLDLVKTRIQLSPNVYPNLMSATAKIWREEGFKGFVGGLGPRLVRKVGSAAVTWVLYEKIVDLFK